MIATVSKYIGSLFEGLSHGPNLPEVSIIHDQMDHKIHTIFINGMHNSIERAKTITTPFQNRKSHLVALLNPTNGTFKDLCRIIALKFGLATRSSNLLKIHLLSTPTHVEKIVLIGHSEGGAIVTKAIQDLQKASRHDLLNKIVIHTLGSSNIIPHQSSVRKIRNHVTSNDLFCLIQNPTYTARFALSFFRSKPHQIQKTLKFYRPTTSNPLREHEVRRGNYNEVLQKKIL
ncbi:MAG: hypothetical protein ACOYL1_04845 [Chlamydiia bacterium]